MPPPSPIPTRGKESDKTSHSLKKGPHRVLKDYSHFPGAPCVGIMLTKEGPRLRAN